MLRGGGRLGVGTELMRSIVEEAGRRGLRILLLETSSLNRRAIHVFEKVGFREVGRIPLGLMIDGGYVDTLLMALEIPCRGYSASHGLRKSEPFL